MITRMGSGFWTLTVVLSLFVPFLVVLPNDVWIVPVRREESALCRGVAA